MARQKSTSNPTQLPCESGMPKPARVPFAPQISSPRSLTVFRVCDHAVCVANASVIAMASAVTTRFMIKPFSRNRAPEYNTSARLRHVPAGRHLRTIALLGQGVDETIPGQGNGANGLTAYSTRKTQGMNDSSSDGPPPQHRPETRVVTGGRDPQSPPRLRQSTSLSRLDCALSERRGLRRPSCALPIRTAWHADHGGARTRGART